MLPYLHQPRPDIRPPCEPASPNRTNLRLQEVSVYTDGACLNNRKENAQSGSGIWLGPGHENNKALQNPGNAQSNQVAEMIAVLTTIEMTPKNQPLKIITDSRYAIEGLTTHLRTWEDQGWINIKNAPLFKRAVYLMRCRSAETAFQWIKGHNGDPRNEGSNELARNSALKERADEISLEIPREFDLQGAKLKTLTQALAYRGIKECHPPQERQTTDQNLELAKHALFKYSGVRETSETIWLDLQHPAIRIRIRQFLYKAIHGTQKIGDFWDHVPGFENRGPCKTCHRPESMKHILIHCREPATRLAWQFARSLWPHENPQWPEVSIGIILACSSISAMAEPPRANDAPGHPTRKGAIRLLQILISETAHLIWVLRCERVIQEKIHCTREIKSRWVAMINKRLTEDRIIAT